MERPKSLITYDGLPVASGGAHSIRTKVHFALWQTMQEWLDTFTTFQEAEEVHLVLYESADQDESFFARAMNACKRRYGRPQRRHAVGGVVYSNTWKLDHADMLEAIRVLQDLGPLPHHWLGGPIYLGIRGSFLLRDPESLAVLPYQGRHLYAGQEVDFERPLGESVMYLRLANPSTCALFMSLPFPELTPSVRSYIDRLQAGLPFNLSRVQWARWQLNAAGTRYYKRKLSLKATGV